MDNEPESLNDLQLYGNLNNKGMLNKASLAGSICLYDFSLSFIRSQKRVFLMVYLTICGKSLLGGNSLNFSMELCESIYGKHTLEGTWDSKLSGN